MAIQIPDAGTGNGATGDNEFVLWTKVINNFSDQTNAASRLVGTANNNVVTWKKGSVEGTGLGGVMEERLSLKGQKTGFYYAKGGSEYFDGGAFVMDVAYLGDSQAFRLSNAPFSYEFYLHHGISGGDGTLSQGAKIYHDKNTTIVNGSLKPSSPVVKIHTNSLELNDDAERMGVTLNKRGVGDYLLQNTTGLRNDGGWRIELPQDVNGNPYFAVAYNELENNDIEVKTYKRIFDMNTFMFVPDLDKPVDIKEGRSIAIRFNDLPLDDVDDIQTEEIVDLDK